MGIDLDEIMNMAKADLSSRGSILPIFIADTEDNKRIIVACPFANENEKIICLEYVKMLFFRHMVKSYIFYTESWYVEENDAEGLGDIPPSEHPNRKESITILKVEDEKKEMMMVQIVAKNNGAVVFGEPMKMGEGGGIFTNLLIPKEYRQGIMSFEDWEKRLAETLDPLFKNHPGANKVEVH